MGLGGRDGRSRFRLPAVVLVVGLVLSGGLALAAEVAHDDNERRLIQQRAKEVAAVLTASIPAIEAPLATTAELVEADTDAALFESVMGTQVGDERRFTSASLWLANGTEPLAVIGDDPALAAQDPSVIEAFLDRSAATDLMTVIDLVDSEAPRLGYGFTAPGGSARYVVYAEQALPASRTQAIQSDSAFADLDYALYLGPDQANGTLLLASTADLPLDGRSAEETTDFGDTELHLVAAPMDELGGDLLARLPLVVLLTGLLMTVGAVLMAERLQRRRRVAEGLAEEVTGLYAEQRAASLTLQQSLLPRALPDIDGLEIGAHYAPGVSGTEVGGDWYDVVDLGARTMLIIGDVSGRGLGAASVMAAVRHSARALAFQGDDPAVILEKLNRRGANELGEHFATVLCASLDREQGSLRTATAGHPPPLVLNGSSGFADVIVGPPVGAAAGAEYQTTTTPIAAGATIILYTDGLFERRGESVDVGLERLRASSEGCQGHPEEVLTQITEALTGGTAHDDAAMLAVRWTT